MSNDTGITYESAWERPGAGRGSSSRVVDDDGRSYAFDWMTPPSQWAYIPYQAPRPRAKRNRLTKGGERV